jgi:hypothetical protein
MNRLALHESAAGGLSPTDLVDVATRTGFDSVGLRVAHSPGADLWWTRGAGSPELRSMITHLLTSRISVLDVGRVELGNSNTDGSNLGGGDGSQRTVLDLAERLGARYVTAGGSVDNSDAMDFEHRWNSLLTESENYQVLPLLVPVPGTAVATAAEALTLAARTGGGVVLTVSTHQSAFDIETQVLEAGSHLGYLRLLAEDLDGVADEDAAGLLATVPVHVPIAVGTARPTGGGDLAPRARRWSRLIDSMLEHPLARARRLGGGSVDT